MEMSFQVAVELLKAVGIILNAIPEIKNAAKGWSEDERAAAQQMTRDHLARAQKIHQQLEEASRQ